MRRRDARAQRRSHWRNASATQHLSRGDSPPFRFGSSETQPRRQQALGKMTSGARINRPAVCAEGDEAMPGYLKRIHVKGYKSLGNVSLDFRPVNVLIGANSSDKTNFLSIFRLLKAVFSGNLAEFGLRSDVNTLFFNGLKNTEAIELSVTAEDAVYEASLSVTDSGRLFLSQERLTDADASVKYSAAAMPESGLQRCQANALPSLSLCRRGRRGGSRPVGNGDEATSGKRTG